MEWILGVTILLLYNIFVSLKLIRYGGYSRGQKITQVLIIWLLPLFGAFLVYSIISSTTKTAKSYDRDFIPNDDNNKTIG